MAGEAGRDAEPTRLLSVDFTTQTLDGPYAPYNYGAVWVEDANGEWVHTLEIWYGLLYANAVVRYSNSSAPQYAGLFGYDAPPDVVTSATWKEHGPHHCTWDLLDEYDQEVPDGDYTLVIEFSEFIPSDAVYEVPFTKSAEPFIVMGQDAPGFTQVQVSLQ